MAAAGTLVGVTAAVVLLAAASKSARFEPSPPNIIWGMPASTPIGELTPSVGAQGSVAPTSAEPGPSPSSEGGASTTTATPSDPIADLRMSIQQQVTTGHLNPDKASDLYKKVDDIAQAINAGNIEDARRKIQDFRNRIATLLSEGQLTAAGHDVLARDLDAIPLP